MLRPVGLPASQLKGCRILTSDYSSIASVSMVDYFFGILWCPSLSKNCQELRPVYLPPWQVRGCRTLTPDHNIITAVSMEEYCFGIVRSATAVTSRLSDFYPGSYPQSYREYGFEIVIARSMPNFTTSFTVTFPLPNSTKKRVQLSPINQASICENCTQSFVLTTGPRTRGGS